MLIIKLSFPILGLIMIVLLLMSLSSPAKGYNFLGRHERQSKKADESQHSPLIVRSRVKNTMNSYRSRKQNQQVHNYHHDRKWVVMLNYMHMSKSGYFIGDGQIGIADIFSRGFNVAPCSMNTQMLMLEIMHMITHRITLMLMIPYIYKNMDHVNVRGVNFTTQSHGIGDLQLQLFYKFLKTRERTLQMIGGLSLPTGSINKRSRTPMANNTLLPYPMQLGSGTVDIVLGLTYKQIINEFWQLGFSGKGLIRTGKNNANYAFGDAATLGSWLTYVINPKLNIYVKANGSIWGNICGADARLHPSRVPTADPDFQAGRRISIILRVNLFGKSLTNHKSGLSIGVVVPIYQHLDGPQLGSSLSLMTSFSLVF